MSRTHAHICLSFQSAHAHAPANLHVRAQAAALFQKLTPFAAKTDALNVPVRAHVCTHTHTHDIYIYIYVACTRND